MPIYSASRLHDRSIFLTNVVSKSATRLPPASTPLTVYYYYVWETSPISPESPPYAYPSVPSLSLVVPAAQAARPSTSAGEEALFWMNTSHLRTTHQPLPQRKILPHSAPRRVDASAADRRPPTLLIELTREGCGSRPDGDE